MGNYECADRNINLYGMIDFESAEKVVSIIRAVNKLDDMMESEQMSMLESLVSSGAISQESIQGLEPREPIVIDINSGGGIASAGFSIISAIENSETPIVGYVTGDCMSMAIAVVASCHFRMATQYSNFMIHDVFGGVEGKYNDIKSTLQHTDQVRKNYKRLIMEYTDIKGSEFDDIVDGNSDYHFSPRKANEMGLIDMVDIDDIDEDVMLNKLYGLGLEEEEKDVEEKPLALPEKPSHEVPEESRPREKTVGDKLLDLLENTLRRDKHEKKNPPKFNKE